MFKMKNSTHPIDELELMAYLDGELPRERAAAAALHLEDCRECQALARDLKNVSQELASWQITPSDSQITPEILSALDEHVKKQEGASRKRRRSWPEFLRMRRVWLPGMAALVAVLLISTFNVSYLRPVKEFSSDTTPSSSPSTADQTRSSGYYDTDGQRGLTSGRAGKAEQRAAGKLQRNLQAVESKQGTHEVAVPTGPMIIRTAELTLTATDFEQVRGKLEETLKRYNGYLGQLTVTGPADAAHTLTATLRVPADKLDAAVAELKNLGRVDSESQKGDEVSQQYIDLQARLKNARNTEETLLDILRHRTGKLADVLDVEREIASVREEIERMQAEKKSLEKQVAFSTVNLRVTEDYKQPVHVVPNSTSRRIRDAAVDGYETLVAGLINLLLFIVSWGPSLLVWGLILFFPVRMLWKRWRQRNTI